MPKVKTLFIFLLVITFSVSLFGCGLITSRTASTDEVVEMGGQVPEWLLLSHRSLASDVSETDDMTAIDEDEEDEDVDDAVDDSATAESDQPEQTETAPSEVAQAVETERNESTEQQQPSTGTSEKEQFLARIVPGTREHLIYLNNRQVGESKEEFVDRLFKELEEEAEEETGDWFHDRESPSGWGG